MIKFPDADDLGDGGNQASLDNGNAGPRVGCGLVEQIPVARTGDIEAASDRNSIGNDKFLDKWQTIKRKSEASEGKPEYICSLVKDEGSLCHGSEDAESKKKFYFDKAAKRCKKLHYLGCDGNSNLFNSYTECADFCGHFNGKRYVI